MLVLKSEDPNVKDKLLHDYEEIRPMSTYSPWNKDIEFWQTMSLVKSSILIDPLRCYELWSLVEQSKKNKSGALIEIGAFRGGSGALIAKKAKLCGIKDTVYLCETFEGVVKAGENDPSYFGGEHSETSVEVVNKLIFETFELDNVKVLKGVFPEETAHEVEGETFRFCHIDVDVYQSAKDSIDWIWERMEIGGIVVYDDFGSFHCKGITKFVEEQIHLEDRIFLHNLNGHAVMIKIS
jgi:O-methyltransferase